MQPFEAAFTAPTWQRVLVLVAGAILVPGRRTIASVLRVMGLGQVRRFSNYHRVLSRNTWSDRWLSGCLLRLLVDTFVPKGEPVVIGPDDTIERRWGIKIKARGIYRDPVRSSRGHFVKASGLRWLSFMVLPEIPWAGRVWALPFLTILAPSLRYWQTHRPGERQYKKLTDWARQGLIQAALWLPDRRVIGVGDASFAAIELLNDVRPWVTMITRLRLDAGLYHPPPRRRPGQRGRPRLVGKRQPTLKQRLANPRTRWCPLQVTGWYGRGERTLEIVSGTALWHKPGHRVPIRYVLVRDPKGKLEPQAFLCTDLQADPLDILRWFVRRWSVEVTFSEVRRHLGVETQRQWSDLAIARTTPFLLSLFSLVTLWANNLYATRPPAVRLASWYRKSLPTFSDALAAVRRQLWTHGNLRGSRQMFDPTKIPAATLNTLIDLACYAA
ncbi:transposase [Rhodovastum atsumiense]|nr:transposase [Rhodovastum atsumiense]CAH2603503.1 transposase [Rhodovastum atsumiense]